MANQYLNLAGLTHFISSIKAMIDSKQNKLTFDTVPTQNSVNPVTSGGVYGMVKGIIDATPKKDSLNAASSDSVFELQQEVSALKDAPVVTFVK